MKGHKIIRSMSRACAKRLVGRLPKSILLRSVCKIFVLKFIASLDEFAQAGERYASVTQEAARATTKFCKAFDVSQNK